MLCDNYSEKLKFFFFIFLWKKHMHLKKNDFEEMQS